MVEDTDTYTCKKCGAQFENVHRYNGHRGAHAREEMGLNDERRRGPMHYRTTEQGYERWEGEFKGDRELFAVHRLLAIAEYGVEPVAGDDVHHANGIPWDNRPENIEILSHSHHRRFHNYLR